MREIFHDHFCQHPAVDRLRDVIREAFSQVPLSGADHRVCGQTDDRHIKARAFRIHPDPVQCLRAIHDRHSLIHQYEVIPDRFRHLHRFSTAGSRINLHLSCFQEPDGHFQIHLRIIDDEYAGRRRVEVFPGRPGGPDFLRMFRKSPAEITQRLIGDDLLGNGDGKDGTLAIGALHGNGAAHDSKKALCNGKTQSRALDRTVALDIKPVKPSKQLLHLLITDPDPRVTDISLKEQAVILPLSPDRQTDVPLIGVLYGVGQEIYQNLAHPDLIAAEVVRERFIHIDQELQGFLPGPEVNHIAQII